MNSNNSHPTAYFVMGLGPVKRSFFFFPSHSAMHIKCYCGWISHRMLIPLSLSVIISHSLSPSLFFFFFFFAFNRFLLPCLSHPWPSTFIFLPPLLCLSLSLQPPVLWQPVHYAYASAWHFHWQMGSSGERCVTGCFLRMHGCARLPVCSLAGRLLGDTQQTWR